MKPIPTTGGAQASALHVEWLKIRRYRTFWIIMGLFLLSAGFGIYVYNAILNGVPQFRLLFTSDNSFSSVWYDVCYVTSQAVIFLSLLMVLLMGNEFQYRTHRQNVIDGWTRLQFLHAKWAFAGVMSLLVGLFAAVAALVVGLSRGATITTFGSGIQNLGWIVLQSLVYLGGGLVLTTLIRRGGLALIVLLGYFLMVDNLVHALFKYKMDMLSIGLFLPFEATDQLMPIPRIGDTVEQFLSYEQLPKWMYASAAVFWIAIFYAVSRWRTLHTDW